MRLRLSCLIVVVFSLTGCENGGGLKDFKSDGCSLFPDQSIITKEDWCECCFVHDLAYWRGGTEEERELADLELRDCVLEKTGDEVLAEMMYQGVRIGGSPYFYNWYRWGYGWDYERKYQPLTEGEEKLADEKLRDYFEENPNGFCGEVMENNTDDS